MEINSRNYGHLNHYYILVYFKIQYDIVNGIKSLCPSRNKKRLNKFSVYLTNLKKLLELNIMVNTADIEIRRIILGAFFGAIYSIVIVLPLIFIINNNNELDYSKAFFFPLNIWMGYATVCRSLEWNKNQRSVAGGSWRSILQYKIALVDIILLLIFIGVAILMYLKNLLTGVNTLIWLIGIVTVLILQKHSIKSLLNNIEGYNGN